MASFSQQNRDGARLYQAQKAAAAAKPKADSWWARPNLSRAEFNAELRQRHGEIMQSRNPGTRSLGKVI